MLPPEDRSLYRLAERLRKLIPVVAAKDSWRFHEPRAAGSQTLAASRLSSRHRLLGTPAAPSCAKTRPSQSGRPKSLGRTRARRWYRRCFDPGGLSLRVAAAPLAISARAVSALVSYCGRASFGRCGGYLQQHRHCRRRDGSKSAASLQKLAAGSMALRFDGHRRLVAHIFLPTQFLTNIAFAAYTAATHPMGVYCRPANSATNQ